MLGKDRSARLDIRMSAADRQRIEQLAALTNQTMSELVVTCVKYSAHAVRKQYIKQFVEDALTMPDPFESDSDPVFDESGAPFEDRLLAAELTYQREQHKPTRKSKRPGRATPHDIRASIDASDIALANEYERRYGPAGTSNNDDAVPIN